MHCASRHAKSSATRHTATRERAALQAKAIIALGMILAPWLLAFALHQRKASQVLHTLEKLSAACRRYHADTGRFAHDDSDAILVDDHPLSHAQGVIGWHGPYVESPLSTDDNPFGGRVVVHEDLRRGDGFDLLGSGHASGVSGQVLEMTHIPEAVAAFVNDALDQRIGGDWRMTGRVEYSPAQHGGTLLVLIGMEKR